MSARTPFVPQKSASHPHANQNERNTVTSPVHDNFRSNGLLSGSMDESLTSSNDQTASPQQSRKSNANDPDPNPLMAGINKPLNISGFAKKKLTQQPDSVSGRSRKSFEDPTARSLSPKPFLSNQQALRLAAPRPSSPFFPSSSGFVSMNGFRAPSLPIPSKLQSATSADEFSSNHAHTTRSDADTGAMEVVETHRTLPNSRNPSDRFTYSPSYNPALVRSRSRTASHPSLEKIHEGQEEELNELHNPDNRERHAGDFTNLDSQSRNEVLGSDDGNEDHSGQTLRRTSKRIQRTDEDEDELEYGNAPKRYKTDATNDLSAPYSRIATPAARYSHSPGRQPVRVQSPYRRSSGLENQISPVAQEHSSQGHALHSLLGHDLDVYMNAHVEAYEDAKKKWTECSMDDWKAGAEEITEKFAKMIEFVKDHMTSKLALYGSLHSAVAAHSTVLSEREQALKDVQENLVREGGNVVGGSMARLAQNDKEET